MLGTRPWLRSSRNWKPCLPPGRPVRFRIKNLSPVAKPSKPAIYLIDKPDAQQSVVIAGTVAPPPDPGTELVLETTNNVFGGTFGARLNMNLREDKHWTYGAASVLYGARAQRPYLAYSSVQADKTAETISEILKEMSGMVDADPVTDEELDKVKQQGSLELPGSHETMNSVGNLIGDLVQFGLPLDYYDSYVERLSAVTVDQVTDCAKSILEPRAMIWLVVGDRAAIEDDLRKLNIGEIIPVNA